MDFLTRIITQTRVDLLEKKIRLPLSQWVEQAERIAEKAKKNRFAQALAKQELQIIAEIKKASPSKGLICTEFDAQAIAADYKAGGAAAISVLTEPHFFQGQLDDLDLVSRQVEIPLLRKDFIVDEYQIFQARVHGGDAILLIAAALTDAEIRRFLELCEALHLDALVEVHDSSELLRAIDAGSKVIGINNRDLKTFQVDIETSLRLVLRVPAGIIRVTESGLFNRLQVQQMQQAGFHAALIGEALMTQPDRIAFLRSLRGV